MNNTFFRAGSYYLICDICGQKYHKEQIRIRWDNMVTCPTCFEMRHPQDFLRARQDRQAVPISRPRPTDVFRETIGAQDDITFSDSFNTTLAFNRIFSDSIGFSDILTSIHGIGRVITDSQTFTDSGVITLPLYIDVTYFAEDYMATTQGF